MTDEAKSRHQTAAAVITGVMKKTALIVCLAASAVLVFSLIRNTGQRWWFIPASILFGGALGLLNFRWLAVAVERIYLREGARSGVSIIAAAIVSILKLSVIFVILFVVIKWRLLHIFGLIGGLTLCFMAVLWEGLTFIKNTFNQKE